MRSDKMIAHESAEVILGPQSGNWLKRTCPSLRATLPQRIAEAMILSNYTHKDFISWNFNPNISPPLALNEVIDNIEANSI